MSEAFTFVFDGRPVIGVIRHDDRVVAAEIARAAMSVLPAVEVTFTVPDAAELIAALAKDPRATDGTTLLGAGTVLSAQQAEAAIAAGAAFLVSPAFVAAVADVAAAAGVPYVPGAFTPTEVLAAAQRGASVVKLFPASVLGPDFLAAVCDVAPGVRFVPTGGIAADNVAAWMGAGAHAVGVGGSLTTAHGRGGGDAVVAEATRIATLVAGSLAASETGADTTPRSTPNGAIA